MTKLDFELRRVFGGDGNKEIALNFIKALDIKEAKPLQEWVAKAESEHMPFPDGLSKEELIKTLEGPYFFGWAKMENLGLELSGEFERDTDKLHENIWIGYQNERDKFNELVNKMENPKFKPIIVPIKTHQVVEIDMESAQRALDSLKNLPQ